MAESRLFRRPSCSRAIFAAAAILTAASPAATPGPLTAATPAAPLDWESCAREALAANPALKRARYNLDSAQARRNASFSGFVPRISAGVSTSDSDDTRPYFDDAYFRHDRYRASLSASQSLFSGFSTVADVAGAYASTRRAAASLRAAEAALRQRLRTAFVGVLYLQEYVKVQESIAARREGNASLVELRYQAGLEDRGAAMRARADASQATLDVTQARRSLILAQHRLARELGRDDPSPIQATGDWACPPPPENPDIALLAEETPEVAQAVAGRDGAKADLVSTAASFWPSASASASVGWQLTKPEQLDFRSWDLDDLNENWSLSVSLSYLLFNGGQRWYSLKAAQASLRTAEEALTEELRDARVELTRALFDYANAHENVVVVREYLDASRVRAEVGRARYENGLLEFTRWDIIENELVQAERRHVAARRDALNAEADWRRVMGKGFSR